MEVLAARALKPSLRRELAFMKSSTQQVFCEELLCLNGTNGVSGDDFSVDDLLDFSNGEFQQNSTALGGDIYEEEYEEGKDSYSVSSQDRSEEDSNSNSTTSISGGADSDSIFASELAVPVSFSSFSDRNHFSSSSSSFQKMKKVFLMTIFFLSFF